MVQRTKESVKVYYPRSCMDEKRTTDPTPDFRVPSWVKYRCRDYGVLFLMTEIRQFVITLH